MSHIRNFHERVKQQILKSFSNADDYIEKGKKYPEGHVAEWGGKKYRKEGGKWKPLSEVGPLRQRLKDQKKQERGERDESMTPLKIAARDSNLKERIKQYNEAKNSRNTVKRRAAYKELVSIGNKFKFKRRDWNALAQILKVDPKEFK